MSIIPTKAVQMLHPIYEQEISIRSNPTDEILTIEYKLGELIYFSIFNSMGNVVLTEQLNSNTDKYDLSVKDLPNGLYVINFFYKNKKDVKKFVVIHK